jgi:glycosyltransferase involved in cell wall biosynthesis
MPDLFRLVWAYDREHLQHPFIVLGLTSFAAEGVRATIISGDTAPPDAPYAALNGFSFAKRQRNWEAVAKDHTKRLRRKQEAAEAANKNCSGFTAQWRGAAARFHKLQGDAAKAFAIVRRDTIDTWTPYLRGFSQLMRADADVIMASRPEAAMWAALAAKLRGIPFVYFPFELYGDQLAKPHPFIAAVERFILRHWVDGLVTQNEMRAKVYRQERRARVEPAIVHNFKPPPGDDGREPCLRAKHPQLQGKRIVLYEGQLVGGRWLDRLANAVLHLPDDVFLVMMGPEKAKWLKTAQAALEAPLKTGRLLILPPAPHDDLPPLVADADLGVIIYDDSVRNNVFCEPGKLVDYIAAGVPVIAPNFPTIAPIIERHEIGVCFDGGDPEKIAQAILAGLARSKSEWAPALCRASATLTWESQFPALSGTVKAAARRHAAAKVAPEPHSVSA